MVRYSAAAEVFYGSVSSAATRHCKDRAYKCTAFRQTATLWTHPETCEDYNSLRDHLLGQAQQHPRGLRQSRACESH